MGIVNDIERMKTTKHDINEGFKVKEDIQAFGEVMTITQTVEIPDDRWLTIKVPPQVPTGETILTFTPSSSIKRKMTEAEEIEYINRNAESLNKEAKDVLSYQVDIF